MEKLQIAIEKARSNRVARQGVPAGVSRSQTALVERAGVWNALPEMTFDPSFLESQRITAFTNNSGVSHYDILRTRVRDEARRRNIKRIAFTSARPQAGKSTTLANLSFSFARMSHYRTMIFDFDLRRPALAKILGQNPQYDMGQLLRGEIRFEDHIKRYGENTAYGLNCRPVRDSSELLQSEQTQDFLNAVDEVYQPDLMLFDMPPFLDADDTQGFLGFVDGVILVVEAERTTRNQIDAVEQKLTELTTVVGVVLNKCPFPDETDAGSYGYKYY